MAFEQTINEFNAIHHYTELFKYFLSITPKLLYNFKLPLERIAEKVDCTGRLIKVTCPSDCNLYHCPLHSWQGKIIGRFSNFTSEGFECKCYPKNSEMKYVELNDARKDVTLPTQVCHIEASLSNIRYIFQGVLPKSEVDKLTRNIRVLSGDLQSTGLVSLEVGRKRFEECISLAKKLSNNFDVFETRLNVRSEPLRAIEGVEPTETDFDNFMEDEDEIVDVIPF